MDDDASRQRASDSLIAHYQLCSHPRPCDADRYCTVYSGCAAAGAVGHGSKHSRAICRRDVDVVAVGLLRSLLAHNTYSTSSSDRGMARAKQRFFSSPKDLQTHGKDVYYSDNVLSTRRRSQIRSVGDIFRHCECRNEYSIASPKLRVRLSIPSLLAV